MANGKKGSTIRREEREGIEHDRRSKKDPLQKQRQDWLDSDDRYTKMLGYIADAHSHASARLRADPRLPITKSEFDRWMQDSDNADLFQIAMDFGEAKLTDGLRAQALNLEAGKKGSHVATQVMMRVIGVTPAQIQRTANEKPKPEDQRYVPPEQLKTLTDEELEALARS